MRGNRQRQRTRHALLDAGQRLFATRSVDAVTIDDIVEQADVAKGSFYNHFSDKQAFADAVWELVQGDVEFHIYRANQDIADPAMRAVGARDLARFFQQEGVGRPGLAQLVEDDLLGPLIGVGDEIRRPLARDLQVLDLAEILDQRAARLDGSGHHDVEKGGARH